MSAKELEQARREELLGCLFGMIGEALSRPESVALIVKGLTPPKRKWFTVKS